MSDSTTTASQQQLRVGWQRVKLGEALADAQLGFACGERDPSGVIQLRMNNVTNDGRLDWTSFIRVPADAITIQTYRLKRGDVLFNNTNSTDLVGKSALFENHDEPVVFSNHFTRLRTDAELIDASFLALWLQQQWQQRMFANICDRWIGQSAVQRNKLLALEMPLPPLPEQRRIAKLLREQMAAVDGARRSAEAQLEAAQALPAAYLCATFDRHGTNEWPRRTLGDVAVLVQNGIYKSSEHYGNGHPFLRMYNIQNESYHLQLEPLAQVNVNAKELETYGLKVGDLLVSRVNSFELVGKCAWVDSHADGYVYENMLVRVRCNDSVDSQFIAQEMGTRFVREQIQNVAKRAIGQASINSSDIRSIQLPLPSLNDQHRIAAALSARLAGVERLRRGLEKQLESIEKLPAALLRRAFNGEL